MSTYAYVMVMFGGDKYLPGILVMGYTIRYCGAIYDIVVMVTNDVSENSVREMKKMNMKVVHVNYLDYKINTKFMSKKQIERYSWMSKSFTKWNCLELEEYKKVLFLDCDMIVVKNLDSVFETNTPAGVFESPYDERLLKPSGKKSGFPNFYNSIIVKPKEINNALTKKGFVTTAACVLLSPDKKDFKKLCNMLSEKPFGFNCTSGMDEQAISYYYSLYKNGPKKNWINLGPSYAFLEWKYKELKVKPPIPDKDVKVIDFVGSEKPWMVEKNKYPDVRFWYKHAIMLHKSFPDINLEVYNSEDLNE